MGNQERRASYGGLWALGLAFGWIESSVVVVILTSDIRAAALKVEGFRERLMLMGRADLVEQPDGFFH